MADHDRDGGGSRGRQFAHVERDEIHRFVWNPALHASYCPQNYPPPADGGGSSWLCCCTEALTERDIGLGGLDPGGDAGREDVPAPRSASARDLARVAAEDRAATVHLYGEQRVEALEREANK